jgi:uncharacterized protein related to proFAR isomerase
MGELLKIVYNELRNEHRNMYVSDTDIFVRWFDKFNSIITIDDNKTITDVYFRDHESYIECVLRHT